MPNEAAMPLREFRLHNLPCWECGRPALAFVPQVGVKHRHGWCRTSQGAEDPRLLAHLRDTRPFLADRAA